MAVNLVGGCHADEPVGPRLLNALVRYLASSDGDRLKQLAHWSVIPHVNPDGAVVNVSWQAPDASAYDFVSLLKHRVRELPGDDIEFGFPSSPHDVDARSENRAAKAFWEEGAPYDLHVSMHGMSVSAGPYFLVERSWWPRFRDAGAARELETLVRDAGYVLHDVERHGEKGFHRLAPGFCSRPDAESMRRHFLALGDESTAGRFRPSSMETVRSMGGDPLTLVTEMPLFLTPGVGEELGPPDPALVAWRERIAAWQARLRSEPGVEAEVRKEVESSGLVAMPVADQMRFQWAFMGDRSIRAGLDLVAEATRRPG